MSIYLQLLSCVTCFSLMCMFWVGVRNHSTRNKHEHANSVTVSVRMLQKGVFVYQFEIVTLNSSSAKVTLGFLLQALFHV